MVILTAECDRLRGFSHDFYPGKAFFHFHGVDPSGEIVDTHQLALEEIHAVFSVRDFAFDREGRYTSETAPAVAEPPPTSGAKQLRVECVWGEVMEGLTYGYEPNRPGFFLFPTAPEDRVYNLERAFLTRRGVEDVHPAA